MMGLASNLNFPLSVCCWSIVAGGPDSVDGICTCDDGSSGRNGTSIGRGRDWLTFRHFPDFPLGIIFHSSSATSARILVHCAWIALPAPHSVHVPPPHHLLPHQPQRRLLGDPRSGYEEIQTGKMALTVTNYAMPVGADPLPVLLE